jgi:DNA-binding LacI/PurR family transcriptional regulator
MSPAGADRGVAVPDEMSVIGFDDEEFVPRQLGALM